MPLGWTILVLCLTGFGCAFAGYGYGVWTLDEARRESARLLRRAERAERESARWEGLFWQERVDGWTAVKERN